MTLLSNAIYAAALILLLLVLELDHQQRGWQVQTRPFEAQPIRPTWPLCQQYRWPEWECDDGN